MRGEKRRRTPHLGDHLHPRNRYANAAPDFYALGKLYPEFRQYLQNVNDEKQKASLPFNNPEAVRSLTTTLLKHDFGLDWTIPINRLCPPLPNRLNYIHWIEDLLLKKSRHFEQDDIHGIDIGTGASCIYALLGAKMNNWSFIATEIDQVSYESALANVKKNSLESRIQVKHTLTMRLLSEPLEGEKTNRRIDFCMCNPPFFGDISEADTNPESSCMGSQNEMVCDGGEVAFVSQIIKDSALLQDRFHWFTSLVGKKQSLRKILSILREKKVKNICTTEFLQGRTKRWGIAWSYHPNKTSEVSENQNIENKVFGRKKEEKRLQELMFEVFSSSEKDACTSLNQVMKRIQEYFSHHREVSLREKAVESTSIKMIFGCEKTGNTSFHGSLEVKSGKSSSSFEVVVCFKKGRRDMFWTFVEGLKADTLRTGRKWRRKRLKVESNL